MLPSVKQHLPDFIKEYLIYCDCFTDINKQKTCWVLTRNLQFFEFYHKQLVAAIDLQRTCLAKVKTNLENYTGSKGKWGEVSNIVPVMTESSNNSISLGKYVFHVMNVYKIYVIIKCWDKCVILKRLADFKGFEIKAEHDGLHSYRVIHGTIKYCPVLELKFKSDELIKTDLEDNTDVKCEEELINKKVDMRQLMEQIRCAKTELQLHKSITAQSFHTVQNNLTLGPPLLRSFKIEEKQILCRCGDIWKRFTAHDDLVIGVPLVNQCTPPNLSIVRNLTPILHIIQSPENSVQLEYRLFQLKLKFDEIHELETLLDCENEQLQEKIWCVNGDLQLLPESFAVLLIKFKISEIASLKEVSLILNYDVIKHLIATPDTTNNTCTMPLQLFLQNINFQTLLFEERRHYEIKFLPHTLQQDFLTIVMTSVTTKLKISYKTCKDLEIFEHFIQDNLDFLKPTLTRICQLNTNKFNTIFYNEKLSSLWFGSLILCVKEISEDDNNQCLTTWKIHCQTFDKTLLLIKTILNDHLALKCNINSIAILDNDEKISTSAVEFENALRLELLQLQKITSDTHNKNLEELYELQMHSDNIASHVMDN